MMSRCGKAVMAGEEGVRLVLMPCSPSRTLSLHQAAQISFHERIQVNSDSHHTGELASILAIY